ncbi:MAG: sialidase family protein [Bryobacteraceae bacterium]
MKIRSGLGSSFRKNGFLLGFAAFAAAQSLPRAPGAHIVTISSLDARGNEPGIAVNPNDPNQVVAVFQGHSRAAYSTDSGRTFALAEGTTPNDWRVAGDVSTTFGNKGHAFLCYLTFDQLGTTSYWAHKAGRNGIFVRRSLDGGKTWEHDPTALKVFPTGHEPNLQWEDMPRIFADNAPHSKYAGNLYVGWIEWQLDQSIMLFSRSTDDGRTWSTPLRISTHAGLPRDDNGGLVGFVGTVDGNGTIYVIWADGNTIAFTRSRDGGKSFAKSRTIIETAPLYFGGIPGLVRVMGFPQIGTDWSRGKNSGKLYIAWSDYRNGDVDVFAASSSDGGRSWSKPLRVNTDPIHDGNDQFFQWLAVDPITGVVYVQFYDRRNDPSNRKTRITLARSKEGGKTFANYAWTTEPFEGQTAFLGDYTWLAAYKDRVYGVWTEAALESETSSRGERKKSDTATIVRVGTADFTGIQ